MPGRNTIVVLVAAALAIVVVVRQSHENKQRMAELEDELERLDDSMINVAMPMDALREDLSELYVEVDEIKRLEPAAGHPPLAGPRREAVSMPALPSVAPAYNAGIELDPQGGGFGYRPGQVDPTGPGGVDRAGRPLPRLTFAEPEEDDDDG